MLRLLVALLPGNPGGARLHRAALGALHRGHLRAAEALFEHAALRYQREIAVEPLARLRVHQLIARARSGPEAETGGGLALEIERRLCRLDRIESLEPPFPLIEARTLLASWMSGGPAAADSRERAAA